MSMKACISYESPFWLLCSTAFSAMEAEDQPRFDCAGLKEDWDGLQNVREALRAGGDLVTGNLGEFSVARCVANLDILMPLAARSFACAHRRPEIEGLREQTTLTLQAHHRQPDESTVDDWAWELRKLLTFMKRKAARREVSTDLCLHL
ncbi:unnamed protein product [Symbiodinium sp. CCMP2456]|nr:unnamed protein product [Symbiodinium sp. CCMP2456]